MDRPFPSVDTYHVPREMTMKVPTAQLEATKGPRKPGRSENAWYAAMTTTHTGTHRANESNTCPAGNPAQQTISCARHLSESLQVIDYRYSLASQVV